MMTAKIVVLASVYLPAGAIVTGYAVGKCRPAAAFIRPVTSVALARVYKGYGKLRAESAAAVQKGFGTLIGGAEISDMEMAQGSRLWLQVED